MEYVGSENRQYGCPSKLTNEQRALVQQLFNESNLKYKSNRNWWRMILYVYNTEFINPSQRGSQSVSSALQERALISQEVNKNVMDAR